MSIDQSEDMAQDVDMETVRRLEASWREVVIAKLRALTADNRVLDTRLREVERRVTQLEVEAILRGERDGQGPPPELPDDVPDRDVERYR